MHVIRLIDPADDALMRQVYDVGCASKSLGRPWFSPPSYTSWLIGMRDPDPEESRELYGFCTEGGGCLGSTLLFIPEHDNLEKVYADLAVAPQHRRHGVGSALVDHAKRRVRQLGRSTLFTESLAPGDGSGADGHRSFATSRGFTTAWRETTRHLQLPVPDPRLGDLTAAAASRSAGYRIETFVGRVPDDLLPGLADLMAMLAVDAPSGDVDFEAEAVTPERLRHIYAREAEQGRVRLSTLAIEHRTGVVAAQTDLVFDDTLDPVEQEGTYVHRLHRGHRLGAMVKVANLQRLQRDYPGRPFVRTTNAETNAHMVSINLELGFEVVETAIEWVAELSAR
ncbi:GNAT family N-acetyltransferase [Flexivirga lutea]